MTTTRNTLIAALVAMLLATSAARAVNDMASVAPGLDGFVASLEGGWVGQENLTPMGTMGFTALFEWEDDGSLHSRSSLNRETYIDLRFWKDEAGRWMLTEEAGMEGLGVQSYSLAPAGVLEETGRHRWIYVEKPDFLWVDVGLDGETMLLDVTLRGERHVAFRLDKQPAEAWAEIKRDFEARAQQSPEEGDSIHDVVSGAPEPMAKVDATAAGELDPIETARGAVAAQPESADARLALAEALGAAIQENPAFGPRYAFEMLESLTTAIALDPGLTGAYHLLVGYYLNAPPIAGGSVDKATETAERLAELDPDGARGLFEWIASRNAAASGSSD